MMNPNNLMFSKMQKKDLSDRINSVSWYHRFDFGDGLITKPELDLRRQEEANKEFLKKIDFRGKTVLDIGCYDGYWSFFAERKGASKVLAIDDTTQRKRDESAFELAHEIYRSKVEFRPNVSVYELSRLLQQKFDIVLYMGVYYHLTHIMAAFSEVRRVVKSGGNVIVEGGVINDTKSSYAEFYYGREGNEPYRKDMSNWFMPTCRCLKDMLKCCYFDIVDESYMPHRQKKSVRERTKLLISETVGWSWMRPVEYGRMLMCAKPVLHSDPNHNYPPPFGLTDFDPRFDKEHK